MEFLSRLFPFVSWWPRRLEVWRADLVAGVTVATVIIPQALAYPLLAGMPVQHGLYAAFLPVIVAALWGSSRHLSSGIAVVPSLLTASALAPLAVAGSPDYISLAILLALLVGLIQLTFALFHMGQIVNFLSQPVVIGFVNAAALIISLSQISKLFGIPMDSTGWLMRDVVNMFSRIADTHLTTLGIGLLSLALLFGFQRWLPKWPGVLVTVAVATLVSWAIDFERKRSVSVDAVRSANATPLVAEWQQWEAERSRLQQALSDTAESKAGDTLAQTHQRHTLELLRIQDKEIDLEIRATQKALREIKLQLVVTAEGSLLFDAGRLPPGIVSEPGEWRITGLRDGQLKLNGGGEVVGAITPGLPPLSLPRLDIEALLRLLPSALVLALVAFTGVISAGRAIALKTRQRLDANQEMLGQGLANLAGSLTQCYPVGGAIARSAVNLRAGARTGMASVFTGLTVLLVLLFFTPLLYHMPLAVLSAVLIMAVLSLINFSGMRFAWKANRHDGAAAWVTFIATLVFAPSLDRGILLGAGLSLVLYLYRRMKPRVALLAVHPDGTLRDARLHQLPLDPDIAVVRFDGALYFADADHFESAMNEARQVLPKARAVLLSGAGLNEIDATGQATLRAQIERLHEEDVAFAVVGLKHQITEALKATGVLELIGEENLFRDERHALESLHARFA